MKSRVHNLENARELAALHVMAAVAKAIMLGNHARPPSAPTFIPSGLGSLTASRTPGAREAALATDVMMLEVQRGYLTAPQQTYLDEARQALDGYMHVSDKQAKRNAEWVQREQRRRRRARGAGPMAPEPLPVPYLVHIEALTVETRSGHLVTVQAQQHVLDVSQHVAAFQTVRHQTRAPVRRREGRWYAEAGVPAAVRAAWQALADALPVHVQEGMRVREVA